MLFVTLFSEEFQNFSCSDIPNWGVHNSLEKLKHFNNICKQGRIYFSVYLMRNRHFYCIKSHVFFFFVVFFLPERDNQRKIIICRVFDWNPRWRRDSENLVAYFQRVLNSPIASASYSLSITSVFRAILWLFRFILIKHNQFFFAWYSHTARCTNHGPRMRHCTRWYREVIKFVLTDNVSVAKLPYVATSAYFPYKITQYSISHVGTLF